MTEDPSGTIAFIGYGEAASAFSEGLAPLTRPAAAFDIRTTPDLAERCARRGVRACASNAEAVAGADLILSLVTADQALAAATETARAIAPGALYCDMNSVAPDTKRVAAAIIERCGGRYVDVAVMSPVRPALAAAPLLVCGPHALAARAALAALGFARVETAEGAIGSASSIKMIRSVMVKGLEALTAECALAARQAGVLDAVTASLDASWPGADWRGRFDYNLDRMLVHGRRRAAEMTEVVATLDALGTGSAMSEGTVRWQAAIGAIDRPPPDGLDAKLALILDTKARP